MEDPITVEEIDALLSKAVDALNTGKLTNQLTTATVKLLTEQLLESESNLLACRTVCWFAIMALGGKITITDEQLERHNPDKALLQKKLDMDGNVTFVASAVADTEVQA